MKRRWSPPFSRSRMHHRPLNHLMLSLSKHEVTHNPYPASALARNGRLTSMR